ncbi:MAG: hypothetical protein H0W18_15535 [Acidobacteria bacterium]|nr:hypothetical protein [Acidobacteriota bacterium]
MEHEEPRGLLDRIGVLRHRCDLDLLVFFSRHPRVLLTSESLVRFLGDDDSEIARSLDVLLATGLLTRTQTPTHAARLYVFSSDGPHPDWLPSILHVASTAEGRRRLLAVLSERDDDESIGRRADFARRQAARPNARQVSTPRPDRTEENDA